MIKAIFCLAGLLTAGPILAQPRLGPLPPLPGTKAAADAAPEASTIAGLYRTPQDAALVAFHKAFEAAGSQQFDNAIFLMLIALKRNPDLDKALYDLGILSARGGRWEDAIHFQQEVQTRAPASETAKLAAVELKRLIANATLDRTPEAATRKKYDRQLIKTLGDYDRKPQAELSSLERVRLLEDIATLIKIDEKRWEGHALSGRANFDKGDFAESQKQLGLAVGLSAAANRRGLQNALDLTGGELKFAQLKLRAEESWNQKGQKDQKSYEAAAKAYADLWELKPYLSETGMRAATAYLLADKVDLASAVLIRMRPFAQPDEARKITAMLKQLGEVSPEAKADAARDVAPATQQADDLALRVRREIGSLVTDQMVLVTRPEPALLADSESVVGESSLAVHDPEISGRPELYTSKTSLFALFQSNLPAVPVAQQPPQPPQPDAAQPTAQPSAPSPAVEPSRRPAFPPPPPVQSPAGPQLIVDVVTKPANATVALDKDDSPLNCISPCRVKLGIGRHTLSARLPGYREMLKVFNVSRDSTRWEWEMEAKRGSVQVDSLPQHLPIFLNGVATGQFTPASLTLNEGEYEVAIERGGQRETQKVTVADGSIMAVKF